MVCNTMWNRQTAAIAGLFVRVLVAAKQSAYPGVSTGCVHCSGLLTYPAG